MLSKRVLSAISVPSHRVPVKTIKNGSWNRCLSSEVQGSSRKTALYDFHVSQQGKMVPFAGYLMPVQYASLSITQSHLHTRTNCSIFDVSHMLQSEIYGKDKMSFIESLVTGDIGLLPQGQGSLTLFTNEKGGIIDDLIVNHTKEGHLYIVTNAGCRDKDIPLMKAAEARFKAEGKDVKLVHREDLSLIAVQGPSATRVLQAVVEGVDLSTLYFMNTMVGTVAGVSNCRITRCGYTGEDGVEISVPSESVVKVVTSILDSKVDTVHMAGLGARDSLRLEAGLCLYGNDMDETTTPVEAGLGWLIGKQRKQRQDFPGAEIIMQQIKDKSKVTKRRVGLTAKDGPPPRSHMEIQTESGESIGEVTSGCPSPSLAPLNIAMGYVRGESHNAGSKVNIKVRNKLVPAQVVKMPFIKGKYFMPPKKQ